MMPIRRDAFEEGKFLTTLEAQILDLLERSPDLAFTVGDIVQGLNVETGKNIISDVVTYLSANNALQNLVTSKKIEGKMIRGQTFYIIHKS